MFEADELSPLADCTNRRSLASYDASCKACEFERTFTTEQLLVLKGNLMNERGRDGCLGMGVACDLPELRLLFRDRVEPTAAMPDHCVLEGDCVGPLTVRFWRRSSETAVRRRCPLFCSELHFGPANMGVDWLHCMALGVCGFWIAEAVWDIVDANLFAITGPATDRAELNFARLANELGN